MKVRFEIGTAPISGVFMRIQFHGIETFDFYPDKERALEWAAEFIEAVKSAEIVDLDETAP